MFETAQARPAPPTPSGGDAGSLPAVRVPARLTFAALLAGFAAGIATSGLPAGQGAAQIAASVGALWLRALQMTIIPLVSALLVVGIVRIVAAAEGGVMARRTLGLFAAVLAGGTILAGLLVPLLLRAVPVPAGAVAALRVSGAPAPVPGLAEFFSAIVPANVIDAAARDAVLPTIAFFTLFAMAMTRLPARPRRLLTLLFTALAGAMMVIIGWVLRVAPLGVFALALSVAARSGSAALPALGQYIIVVASMGALVLAAGYVLAVLGGRLRLRAFAGAMVPVQAVAFTTQSSLASLPAMLGACRELKVPEPAAQFVLPLAVALFRATGPAMNLAVAIYVAKLTATPLTPATIGIGIAVALVTTLGSVSLPGTISFVTAIAPVALAMGVPVGPLGVLVAVEMLPDLMRTVGNVTMDVAVTATAGRSIAAIGGAEPQGPATLPGAAR